MKALPHQYLSLTGESMYTFINMFCLLTKYSFEISALFFDGYISSLAEWVCIYECGDVLIISTKKRGRKTISIKPPSIFFLSSNSSLGMKVHKPTASNTITNTMRGIVGQSAQHGYF